MRNTLIILAFLLPLTVVAEEASLDRSVTVERDYNPTTIEARKISPVPTKENLNTEKPEVNYTTWSKAEEVQVENVALKPDRYYESRATDYKKGVAKVGLGFYWQTLGEFYYPLIQTDKYLFDVNLKHLGNFSHNDLPDGTSPRAMEHNTLLNLNFEDQLSEMRLHTNAYVSYNGFDYYGYQTNADGVPADLGKLPVSLRDTTCSYITAGAKFGLYSTNNNPNFEYKFDVGYNYFGNNFSINEHVILANLDLGGEVGPGTLGAEIEAEVEIFNLQNEKENDCLIKLKPYYKVGGERWDLRIGADMNIYGEKGYKRPVTGNANILGKFALVPERLFLNVGIGGYFYENMYSEIIKENKWINPTLIVDPTYSPVTLNFGIKTRVIKGLIFEAGFDYAYILDQYYYVNDTLAGGTLNTFHTVYDNTNKVTAYLGLYFNYVKGLDISVKGKYNHWGVTTIEKGWQRPAWEVNFDAKYTIKEKWCVGLSYNFLGGRYALVSGKTQRMKDVHDLNLTFSYKILDWLELFAQGKNLINIKADTYYGYSTMGINGLIGVTFRF